jgi:hypothetical protein
MGFVVNGGSLNARARMMINRLATFFQASLAGL